MNILLDLYITFAKIGAVTFGGGYAMLPILQREVAETKQWATDEELMDYYAIGQCTPGIIAVNVSTFIGTKLAGLLGGIIATMGVITPSIAIVTIIAMCLSNFQDSPFVIHAFNGIRACVCVLILDTIIKLAKKSITDSRTLLIFLAVLVIAFAAPISPAWCVVLAGIAGIFLMPRKEGE